MGAGVTCFEIDDAKTLMDFAGQPATRATNMLIVVVGDAGITLVHADDGRIDHLHGRIV